MKAQRILFALTIFIFSGLSPTYAEQEKTMLNEAEFDPFEGFNRAMFEINHTLDTVFVRPMAEVYGVIPAPARKGVRNVLTNLKSPVTFANDVLQMDFEGAGETLGRMLINSTLGIGGLFDVATEIGIGYHSSDFAESLTMAGLPSGPYLILPILGPSTPRDIIGRTTDFFLNPVNWVIMYNDQDQLYYIAAGVDLLDKRKEATGFTDELEKAINPYARLRSLYWQSRVSNITEGEVDENDSPRPMKGD